METYFFLLFVLIVCLEFLLVRAYYKSIANEFDMYSQRHKFEQSGNFRHNDLELCPDEPLNYVLASSLLFIVLCFLMFLFDTYTSIVTFLLYIIFLFVFAFVYRDYKRYKIRYLTKGWLLMDSASFIISVILIHYGLFHSLLGVVNTYIEKSTSVVTVPITSTTVEESKSKHGKIDYFYYAIFDPINPICLPNKVETLKNDVPYPNKFVLDILPYLSGDNFLTLPEANNQIFEFVYFNEPFDADSVKLTIVEGYYGFTYSKNKELVAK